MPPIPTVRYEVECSTSRARRRIENMLLGLQFHPITSVGEKSLRFEIYSSEPVETEGHASWLLLRHPDARVIKITKLAYRGHEVIEYGKEIQKEDR